MTYTISLKHNIQDLLSLKTEWEQLQAQSQNQSLFFSWEWIRALGEQYGDRGELWLLLARDPKQHLVGIAPLMKRPFKLGGFLPVQSLEFIAESLGADHADFIIQKGREQAVTRAFLNYLDQHQTWAQVRLKGLPQNSITHQILQTSGQDWVEIDQRSCPYIPVQSDWETYLASLSKNKRKDLRRLVRRLDELYPDQWCCERLTDPQQVKIAMDKLIIWHQAKWEAIGEPGYFNTAGQRALHHDLAQCFLARGDLMLYALSINSEVVGVDYNISFLRRVYGLAGGVNPEYMNHNLGTVILQKVLRDTFEAGLIEYDFLWGEHEYKMRWGAAKRYDLVLSYIASPTARLHHQMIRMGRGLWQMNKRLLPKELRQYLRKNLIKHTDH